MSNDVEFAAPIELPFNDGQLQVLVGPANIAQITRMLRVAKPLVDEIFLLPPDMLDRAMSGGPTEADLAYALSLVCERADMAAELVSAATGADLARVQALLPDRFVYLLSLVVEANADFFARSAAAFSAAGRHMQTAVARVRAQSAGSTPSTS